MIKLQHLTKKFGAFTAVNDLNISVDAGEFYGILGPNGAGKTTTIKMMTGLFTPTCGKVIINGFDIEKQANQAKMCIGYIPDQPFLYDKLTGREFLFFSAGLYRMERQKTKEKIDELRELFEIGSWIDKRTESYSQGMKQRIVICTALLHEPKVLIVDEPLVGLDPRGSYILRQTLRKISQQGVSIFMSTHSLQIAEELCDRIGIIKDGRLIFEDTVEGIQNLKAKSDGKFESVFLELTK